MIDKEAALTSRKLCKQSCSLKKLAAPMAFRMCSARFFLQKLRLLVRTQVCRPGLTGYAREQILREL